MCTVTRPGIAAIASATAVELMVSVLQHPLGCVLLSPSRGPGPTLTRALQVSRTVRRPLIVQRRTCASRARLAAWHRPAPDPRVPRPLRQPQDHGPGVRPLHRLLRHGASAFPLLSPSLLRPTLGRARADPCRRSTCAQILEAYRSDPFSLVQSACEDAKYLERVTGLDKLEEETEALLAEGVDWSEEDYF